MVDPRTLISTREFAAQMRVKDQAVRAWRLKGIGPGFIRISANRVVYDPEEVSRWLASRSVRSTGKASAK